MFRKCKKIIESNLSNSKKALIVYGARQVGKTYIIHKVLEESKLPYFEINLIEREDILQSIKNSLDVSEIEQKISLYSPISLKEKDGKKPIIFLDEIQCYPEIITKIKFLVTKGKFKYIMSGSNLGVELHGLKSFPIGYVEQLHMYPMTFFEFAIASGIKEELFEYIEDNLLHLKKIDDIIHNKFLDCFYKYLAIGGMPEAVNCFCLGKSIAEINEVQKNIINQYKADFIKYESINKRLKVISVFNNIPYQLNKQDRRFIFNVLNKELKFERYEESFLWLKDADVSIPVYNVRELNSPLEISRHSNLFKLFSSDVGLLTSCYSPNLKKQLITREEVSNVNLGGIFENYAAQELKSLEIDPYYYKNKKLGEVDFVFENDDLITTLEVKSGKDYKTHKALNNLINDNNKITTPIVASVYNLETDGKILYIPLYMLGLKNVFNHIKIAQ